VKRKVPLFETEPIVTVCEEKGIDKRGGKEEWREKEREEDLSGRGNLVGFCFFFRVTLAVPEKR
jgi:hypothetical protein